MKRKDFNALASVRLREARALLAEHEYSGAYYLAGYVIECALKACIAKQTERYEFPDKQRTLDSWQHDPLKLVKAARLKTLLDSERMADPGFSANWNVVLDWTAQSRYSQADQRKAEALIRAISEQEHGVLRWIKRHW